jgi:sulfur-oxidizing protein SoxA
MRRIGGKIAGIGLAFLALTVPPSQAPGQSRSSIPPRDSGNPLSELISGYEFSPIHVRALQDDDFDNPGFKWVSRGEALWMMRDGASQESCASCHDEGKDAMRGRAAHYPKFDDRAGKVVTLAQRINICRSDKMEAEPWAHGSEDLLGMTAFLRLLSRGLPMAGNIEGAAEASFERGKTIYNGRMGQLGMSCAGCHNRYYGKSYRGQLISQGHSNGFPAYQLEAQSFLSLHDRFSACYRLMKAEPHPPGADDYVALELYLAWRGAGLPLEAPAVRR